MRIISTTQLQICARRAVHLPKEALEVRPLDYVPKIEAQLDLEKLITRSAFLSVGGAKPSEAEQERVIGGNDLVDEFFFDRALLAAMPVCRIIIKSNSGHTRGYATGFMVSPRLLITNEHVFGNAEEALASLAEFNYRLDVAGNLETSYQFKLRPDQYFYCNESLDFSLVSVEPVALDRVTKISNFGYHRLIPKSGKALLKEWMTIIQHPNGAPRQWAIRDNKCVYDKDPDVVWYKSDTATGSSGAPVLNDSLQVVALHHCGVARRDDEGKYLLNNGQKVDDLKGVDDSLVDWIANAGIRVSKICAAIDALAPELNGHKAEFISSRESGDVLSLAYKKTNEEVKAMPEKNNFTPEVSSSRVVIGTLVLELNGSVLNQLANKQINEQLSNALDNNNGSNETAKEPIIDTNYNSRKGFDINFLGVDTPLLKVKDESIVTPTLTGEKIIPYEHFSVVLHKDRKLAIYTASNVDGRPKAKRPEPNYKYSRKELTGLGANDQEKWVLDPRIESKYQIPDSFYTKDNGAFDKGHIVRRDDVCWGMSFSEIQRANGDTFHVTNCSPQRGNFNRSNLNGIWGNLENYIGAQADAERYCIFSGPVLTSNDKTFFNHVEAVQIPNAFWKVICALSKENLQVFAFLLEQDLTDLALEFHVDAEWKHKQISLIELEQKLVLVEFPNLYHQADQSKLGLKVT